MSYLTDKYVFCRINPSFNFKIMIANFYKESLINRRIKKKRIRHGFMHLDFFLNKG